MSKSHTYVNSKKPIASGILRNLINSTNDNVIRRHKNKRNEENKRAKEEKNRANEMENKRLLNLYAEEGLRPMTPLSSPLSSQSVLYSTIPSSAGGKRRGKSYKYRNHKYRSKKNRTCKH